MRLLPHWASPYPRQHLGSDVLAGIIVTILVIPQSLAYALLAGLPPQAGLYVSIFPVIAYALFGSSMVQAVGPVAITSIMTYSVLAPIAAPGSPAYIGLAAVLALGSGLLLVACGSLRLGFLANLLSRPVIAGFISGSAVLIVFSQLKYFFGVHPASSDAGTVIRALLSEGRLEMASAIGLTAIAALTFARLWLAGLLGRLGIKPSAGAFVVRLFPLLVVLAATLAIITWDLDRLYGVAVVGSVAEGLPGLSPFIPSAGDLRQLALPILLVALIGMVQNISMGQALAIRRRERLDANAELVGLGSANIVSAFSGGMPVGGGVSRTAVNVAAGAQTPLASIVSAFAMLAVVAGAAPLFARLPLAVLAASIIVAAVSMIDLKTLRQAWHYDRADGLAALGTAAGVFLLGLEAGIGLGILFSLATLLYRASTPHIAVIGRIPDSEHFRNVERHKVETLPGSLFLRIDESLFFGNLHALESRLTHELEKAGDTRHVVLIMNAVNRVDATAMEVLSDLNRDLSGRGIALHFAEIKGPVQDRLIGTPLWQEMSGEVFLSVNDAYEALSIEPRQAPSLPG
jgi:sulfate permease, SulP family